MKSSMIMTVAAVLFVAAFAGIVMSDDVDAVDGEYTITYSVDGSSVIRTTENGAFSPLDEEALGAVYTVPKGYELTGWQDATTGAIYTIGADNRYTLTSDITVVPYLTLAEGKYEITFVVGEESYKTTTANTIEGDETHIAIPDGALAAIKAITDGGDKFEGWLTAGAADPVSFEDNKILVSDVTKSIVYTADITAVYDVYWVVDGTIVAHGTSENVIDKEEAPSTLNKPIDPVKEHYSFDGWYDAQGVKFSNEYEFIADTTFTASFEPTQLTVTLIMGDETVTQIAAYGEVYKMPALDSGYAHWATKVVKEVTGEDGTVTTVEEYVKFDFSKALTEDVTLYAIAEEEVPDESIYATFNIEGTIYGPYKVSDRFSIPQTDREGYDFLGWTVQGGDGTLLTSAQVQGYQYTEDVTFIANYVAVEPPTPEEPAFYETTTGQAAIVLIVFVIVLFVAAVYMNIGGLREKLFGWKITRKD